MEKMKLGGWTKTYIFCMPFQMLLGRVNVSRNPSRQNINCLSLAQYISKTTLENEDETAPLDDMEIIDLNGEGDGIRNGVEDLFNNVVKLVSKIVKIYDP
ncbi:hypothetical protein Fmac_032463 [Flemingia macrophylla]|uniref:Uncharacterized protein n=1 Tax=Flemingia macrophylla TaxID=520843 RepID=A0ABD1L501_9FABA